MSFKLKTYIGDFEWNNNEEKPTTVSILSTVDVWQKQAETEKRVIDEIISFSANGEELKSIQNKFQWIPSTTDGTATIWRGGWATFIYENL